MEPVSAAPSAVAPPVTEAGAESFDSWGFRTVQFDGGYDLAFRQVTDVGVGGSVWDAALVLAKYLAQRSEFSDAQFAAHNPTPQQVKAGHALSAFAPATARVPTTEPAAAADSKAAAPAAPAATSAGAGAGASASGAGGAGAGGGGRPLRVCELGAGIGVVGLVAAMRGAQVSITDLPSHVPLIRHNIDLNTFPAPAGASVRECKPVRGKEVTRWPVAHRVVGEAYAWGEATDALTYAPYDLLVGSDLTYDPRFFAPLLHALQLLMDQNTVFLYGYERRTPKELEFFNALKEHFTYHKIHNSRLDPTFQSEDIAIFRIQRRWDKPYTVPKPLAVTPPEPVWDKGKKPHAQGQAACTAGAAAAPAPASK